MFALPYRFGGLAIRNPIITAEEEYVASKTITAELTKAIVFIHSWSQPGFGVYLH